MAAFVVACALLANIAHAEIDTRDVVLDTNKNIVKNTFGNCVRTQWEAGRDACANAPQVAAVAAAKPIKRSRSYIVFFDFDKSNLTESAIAIIKKANEEAASSGSDVSFSLTGYTDRSGSEAYNMKLSMRRANAVKSELIRLGQAAGGLNTSGKGESDPLVPTADGVREPQNRRVEIIYSVE